ncbi:DUF5799 family protein [Haloarcula litorea]|uniref:DUF5799 family protein n=1 Tax=Haloarcula litorea TaxID=3032579 RepID=UPI0023E8E4FE|nr:DUF5799 family protein [Halomicroarcula sp. GDY20]
MSDNDWTDRIAGERMQVDQQFNDRVQASSFSSQQWGLVMTATEFRIENPGDPEQARIVADTSKLGSVMPEMDRIENQSPMGGGGGSGGSGGGGLFSGVKDALGLGGGGGSDERTDEAEQLAQEYAQQLQEKLESNGRWDAIRKQAQG